MWSGPESNPCAHIQEKRKKRWRSKRKKGAATHTRPSKTEKIGGGSHEWKSKPCIHSHASNPPCKHPPERWGENQEVDFLTRVARLPCVAVWFLSLHVYRCEKEKKADNRQVTATAPRHECVCRVARLAQVQHVRKSQGDIGRTQRLQLGQRLERHLGSHAGGRDNGERPIAATAGRFLLIFSVNMGSVYVAESVVLPFYYRS